MKVCDICESKPAKYKCPVCGRYVCEDDFDFNKGVCKVCSETMCEICGKYPSIGYCMICGRNGCEDCLIQVTPVSYVCKECIRQGRYRLETWQSIS
ncbi:hypothetical protein [Staphylothermus marinus]|uniref:hypothetical protein n=1 Tax=Staphylothermus marinus TaxID=2280 RepID=UPI001FCC816D|nr:hypothetical protein [Staphylothermus marinus]